MSGAELIHRPNTLAKRIGPRVRVFTAALLKQAEGAFARIAIHYGDWLKSDLAALDSVRSDIRADGLSPDKLRELGRCARLLRGSGASFGYPIVTRFASLLCEVVERDGEALSLPVLDAYVDAMRAAVRDNVRDEADQTASAILRELNAGLSAG